MRIIAAAAVVLCLWAFPVRAETVTYFGGTFDPIIPVSHSIVLPDTGMTPQEVILPSWRVGFEMPAFDPSLGVAHQAYILVNTELSGYASTTTYGRTSQPEVYAKGNSFLNVTMKILNNGSPIGSGGASIYQSSSCSGFQLENTCTEQISNYLGAYTGAISPDEIGTLELLIDPIFYADIHLGGFTGEDGPAYENYAKFDHFLKLDLTFGGYGSQVDYSYTPVSAVPLPAALPLFLSSVGALTLWRWRKRSSGGQS